jgi:putative tricarboxylic transport membrane protein
MSTRTPRGAAIELGLSIAVLALGIAVAVIASRLPAPAGYSGIGPALMPNIVGFGLIVTGVWLIAEALTGGWRQRAPDAAEDRGEHAFLAPGFVWVSAGLIAQMVLIGNAGFVIAAVALFTMVSRGFGSTRPWRDAAIGAALALAIFFFFVKFLNVNLPAGWLKPLLGAAGI